MAERKVLTRYYQDNFNKYKNKNKKKKNQMYKEYVL